MDRRSFLQSVSNTLMVMTLDPDLALWVPGKKTIFIPAVVKPALKVTIDLIPHAFSLKWQGDYSGPKTVITGVVRHGIAYNRVLAESNEPLDIGDYVKLGPGGRLIKCCLAEAIGYAVSKSEPL